MSEKFVVDRPPVTKLFQWTGDLTAANTWLSQFSGSAADNHDGTITVTNMFSIETLVSMGEHFGFTGGVVSKDSFQEVGTDVRADLSYVIDET